MLDRDTLVSLSLVLLSPKNALNWWLLVVAVVVDTQYLQALNCFSGNFHSVQHLSSCGPIKESAARDTDTQCSLQGSSPPDYQTRYLSLDFESPC